MLDLTTIKTLQQQTTESLLKFHVAEALQGVVAMARESKDRNLITAAEKEECDYHHMLTFLQSNGSDAERGRMQKQLVWRLLCIVDNAARIMRLWHGKDYYSKANKPFEGKTIDEASEELWREWEKQLGMVERYETQDLIFDFIWTMPQLKPKQTANWYEFISRQDVLVQEHFLGALILSAWEYMDEEKMTLLSLLSENKNETVHTTAYIGIALLLQKYEERCTLFQERINLPQKNARNAETLFLIMRETMLIQQSTEVLKKLSFQYEVLKKKTTQLFNGNLEKKGTEEIEELKNNIVRILKESLKKGLDIDLNHQMLIPQSKFLKSVSHWWVPYDEGRVQFQDLFTKENGEESLGIKRIFRNDDCSVNKYALCDMLLQHSQLKQLEAQITEAQNNMEEISESISNSAGGISIEKPNQKEDKRILAIRNKIHNLKRFITYSPIAAQMQEGIKIPDTLILPKNRILNAYFNEKQTHEMCDLMYEEKYYSQLIPFLEERYKNEGATADTLIKLSTCLSKSHNAIASIRCLEQARILDENNEYVLRALSRSYKKEKRFEDQLDVLLELSKFAKDENESDFAIAECLSELERYNEAVKYFLKIDLREEEGNTDARYNLAKCYAIQKRYDKAEDYLSKALENGTERAEWQECIAGFVFFELGKWEKAVDHYRMVTMKSFEHHSKLLLKTGHSIQDIQLLRDMILYRQWT